MRNVFSEEITSIAQKDKRVVLFSGDIGNRLFDNYKRLMSDRFYNCGVAEANMISAAAGLALCGLHPVTYTITPFITASCYEQIKVDVCYHELPVVIVGTGSGLSYAELGATHHACDDISLMRGLPNMSVVCPADIYEVKQALRAAMKNDGPVYIRLGKKGEPKVHENEPDFVIGKGIVLSSGNDVCLIGTGTVLPLVKEAAEKLAKAGISTQVISYHTIKPLDNELLKDVFSKFKVIVAVEEHNIIGGLSSSLSEWLMDQEQFPPTTKFVRIGIADQFYYKTGKQKQARNYFGLTAENISTRALAALGRR